MSARRGAGRAALRQSGLGICTGWCRQWIMTPSRGAAATVRLIRQGR
jgi:hypothetical protein